MDDSESRNYGQTVDWQLHHDNVPTHASCLVQNFFAKHQITQETQPCYSPDLVPCNFWLFPKQKSPLRGKRLQAIGVIQENMTVPLVAIGRTVLGPKVPILNRTGYQCPMYIFLVSCIFFNKCLYFSHYMAGYLLNRPRIYRFSLQDIFTPGLSF